MKKLIDLTGQKFGKLTVLKLHHREPKYYKGKTCGYYYFYLCKCDCGNETIASERRLLNGDKKSCGCLHGGRQCEDITGQRFGKLTVIKGIESYKNKYSRWLCKCDCGNEVKVIRNHLISGNVRSCGCLIYETNTKHGDNKRSGSTSLYKIYYGIKARCYNPKNISYKWYGAKGITMCDKWLSNYKNFKEWAMTHGYKEGLSIERIDNNKNYCPENCKWIPLSKQAKTTSRVRIFEYQGKLYNLTEIAKLFNVSRYTFIKKIKNIFDIKEYFGFDKCDLYYEIFGEDDGIS